LKRSLVEHIRRRIMRWTGYQLRPITDLIIEPTNDCTCRCTVCGAAQASSPRTKGYMDWDAFVRIADHAAELRPKRVCLYAHGEPLLHPQIVEMVHLLSTKHLRVEIVTNGDLLTSSMADALLGAGLKVLVISYPGITSENFNQCRGGFLLPEKEAQLFEVLSACPVGDCDIHIRTMVFPHLLYDHIQEVADFLQKCFSVPAMDYVEFHGYIPWPRHCIETLVHQLNYRQRRCELGLNSLVVLWDGTITPCCYDVSGELAIGTLPQATLANVYNGDTMKEYRRRWFRDAGDWMEICKSCMLSYCSRPIVPIYKRIIPGQMNRMLFNPDEHIYFVDGKACWLDEKRLQLFLASALEEIEGKENLKHRICPH
jgi:radical SAM protein with 4Fe4S-binding SPASM domain